MYTNDLNRLSRPFFLSRSVFTLLAFGAFISGAALLSSTPAWADPLDDARAADDAADDGDLEGAIALYRRALESGELTPNNQAAVYFNRGGVHIQVGNVEQAVQDFTQTVLLRPDHQLAWASRGIALRALGRGEQAVSDFTQALEVGTPDDAEVYNLRGLAYKDLGQYDLAVADHTNALTIRPVWAFATRNRARALFFMGRYRDSATDFEAAFDIEKDPYTSLWRFMAMTRSNQSDLGLRNLRTETRRLRQDAWPAPIVNMFLGELTPNELVQLARDPQDPQRAAGLATEAMFYIGQMFLMQGDAKQASAFFERTIELGVTTFVEYDGARIELERMGR